MERMRMNKMATIEKVCIRQALRDAEDHGMYFIGAFGAGSEPCTRWIVGDYLVTYLTEDADFNAEMLTEDMIGELIIEER